MGMRLGIVIMVEVALGFSPFCILPPAEVMDPLLRRPQEEAPQSLSPPPITSIPAHVHQTGSPEAGGYLIKEIHVSLWHFCPLLSQPLFLGWPTSLSLWFMFSPPSMPYLHP